MRIRELRGDKPQTLVADEMGVAERTYQGWEQGETKPSYRSLQKLANYFGVPEEFILTGGRRHLSRTPHADGNNTTPDPLPPSLEERIAAMERRLETHAAKVEALLQEQSDLLVAIRELVARLTPLLPGVQELMDEEPGDQPPASR